MMLLGMRSWEGQLLKLLEHITAGQLLPGPRARPERASAT